MRFIPQLEPLDANWSALVMLLYYVLLEDGMEVFGCPVL